MKQITDEQFKEYDYALSLAQSRGNIDFILSKIRSLQQNNSSEVTDLWHLTDVKLPAGGGILSYYEGHPYPKKGFPIAETVEKIGNIKKTLWIIASSFSQNKFILVVSVLFFRKNLWDMIWSFLKQSDIALAYHLLLPERYCSCVQEVYRAFDPEDSLVRNLVSMILEFDDAYRYRFQDVVGELNKDNLALNPFKEISRLLLLLAERETYYDHRLKKMWEKAEKLLFILFFSRYIREKVIIFFSRLNPENIKLDEGDRYYANLKKDGYNWGSKFIRCSEN